MAIVHVQELKLNAHSSGGEALPSPATDFEDEIKRLFSFGIGLTEKDHDRLSSRLKERLRRKRYNQREGESHEGRVARAEPQVAMLSGKWEGWRVRVRWERGRGGSRRGGRGRICSPRGREKKYGESGPKVEEDAQLAADAFAEGEGNCEEEEQRAVFITDIGLQTPKSPGKRAPPENGDRGE
mmetsp:Transcript_4596/g.10819  ORF Transcript_4596/g.10819 Transcript_4596/m.10819 type:complete len:183 (+) Transcript_4596:733-1281(+)